MRRLVWVAVAVCLMTSGAFGQGRLRPLRARRPPQVQAAPTFSKEVVRIMQDKCQTCHRPGEVAPFSLLTYDDAWLFSDAIRSAVDRDYMPPWKPVVGDFQNDRRLSPEQKQTILDWVDAGAPEGDRNDLPAPLEFNLDWTLGPPDLILEHERYTPGVNENDDYRCFSVPTGLLADQRIRAVEVRPGNSKIVHHVILYGDPTGASLALDDNDDGPGYSCFGDAGIPLSQIYGGWAPGNRPQILPDGTAQTLPTGSRVSIQVHYHPDGTLQSDETRIGLYFTDENPVREVVYVPLVNQNFNIPAGATEHEVTAQLANPFPGITLHAILPHMHLLGRQIGVTLAVPGGATSELVRIDDWDFEWQDTYWLTEAIDIVPGSRLTLNAIYDNSESNPLNPNKPPIPVGWGNGTNDEMALAFLVVSVPPGFAIPF